MASTLFPAQKNIKIGFFKIVFFYRKKFILIFHNNKKGERF